MPIVGAGHHALDTMSSVVSPARLHLAELRGPERAWLLEQRYDLSVGKHEGPFAWRELVEPKVPDDAATSVGPRPVPPEFLALDGRVVLLPVEGDHHANLTRLRAVADEEGRCLTLFLTDATDGDEASRGRLAFCEQAPEGGWFLCTVWHEWHPAR